MSVNWFTASSKLIQRPQPPSKSNPLRHKLFIFPVFSAEAPCAPPRKIASVGVKPFNQGNGANEGNGAKADNACQQRQRKHSERVVCYSSLVCRCTSACLAQLPTRSGSINGMLDMQRLMCGPRERTRQLHAGT